MVRRLVLGCGRAGETVAGVVSTWGGELRVVVADASRADGLEASVDGMIRGDPTDPETYPDAADVVLVLGDDADRNLTAARRAREAFPDALLVAYAGDDGDAPGLSAVADRVIDAPAVLSDHLLDAATGEGAERARRLLTVLRGLGGRLAVVMHDNPDPDAIASALALAGIARSVGVDADPCYYGDITHQENRALVNLLDLELSNLADGDGIDAYDGVALVDHSRPGVNDGLDPGTAVDVVIDHHPPRATVEADFVDLRSDAGATSTLLASYLERLGIDPTREVATALLYGIRTDTRDFTRETADSDFEAAAFLLPYVDETVLDRVESPSMSPEVLATLSAAIRNREVHDDVLTSGVGRIRTQDVLAQAVDRLLAMEGICIAVVYGIVDDTIYVSARARGTEIDLGEVLREALGAIGSAGGHADMAGAQIPLGILGSIEDESVDSLAEVVDEVVAGRIVAALENPPSPPPRDSGAEIAFEFPLDE
jgi:nanoRNase/pAp phosphatase (c-di-AMP/oligoRNAs hydrolase)